MVDFYASEKYWASKPKDFPISKAIDWDLIRDDYDPFRYSYREDEVFLKKISCEFSWNFWDKWKKIQKDILYSSKSFFSALTKLLT